MLVCSLTILNNRNISAVVVVTGAYNIYNTIPNLTRPLVYSIVYAYCILQVRGQDDALESTHKVALSSDRSPRLTPVSCHGAEGWSSLKPTSFWFRFVYLVLVGGGVD